MIISNVFADLASPYGDFLLSFPSQYCALSNWRKQIQHTGSIHCTLITKVFGLLNFGHLKLGHWIMDKKSIFWTISKKYFGQNICKIYFFVVVVFVSLSRYASNYRKMGFLCTSFNEFLST